MQATLVGDCNIGILSLNTETCELLDIAQSYGCCNLIHVPTRVAEATETLID